MIKRRCCLEDSVGLFWLKEGRKADSPTIARLAEGMSFFAPDGSLTLVFLVSGL